MLKLMLQTKWSTLACAIVICLSEPATECSDYPTSSKTFYHCFCCCPLNISFNVVCSLQHAAIPVIPTKYSVLLLHPVCLPLMQDCCCGHGYLPGRRSNDFKAIFLVWRKGDQQAGSCAGPHAGHHQTSALTFGGHCPPNAFIEGIVYQTHALIVIHRMRSSRALSIKCIH